MFHKPIFAAQEANHFMPFIQLDVSVPFVQAAPLVTTTLERTEQPQSLKEPQTHVRNEKSPCKIMNCEIRAPKGPRPQMVFRRADRVVCMRAQKRAHQQGQINNKKHNKVDDKNKNNNNESNADKGYAGGGQHSTVEVARVEIARWKLRWRFEKQRSAVEVARVDAAASLMCNHMVLVSACLLVLASKNVYRGRVVQVEVKVWT